MGRVTSGLQSAPRPNPDKRALMRDCGLRRRLRVDWICLVPTEGADMVLTWESSGRWTTLVTLNEDVGWGAK